MGNMRDGEVEKKNHEQEEKEDVLFIPPDMKHSSSLEWNEDSIDTVYSTLGINLTKNEAASSDSQRPSLSHRSGRKKGRNKRSRLFNRHVTRGVKSYWRIEADRKKLMKKPDRSLTEPVLPAIILDQEGGEEWNVQPMHHRATLPENKKNKEKKDTASTKFQVDDITRFLVTRGIMSLRDDELEMMRENTAPETMMSRIIPQEYREYMAKLMNPRERKKMLKEIYKTGVVRASCWMVGLFFILYLMPDSRFFAPFIAGFVGGKKAGSTLKAFIAAAAPFFVLGILHILLIFHIIYPFYEIYSPAANTIVDYLSIKLTIVGMNIAGMDGVGNWSVLGRVFVYMVVGAVVGGTLESDVISRGVKTVDLLQITTISGRFQRKI